MAYKQLKNPTTFIIKKQVVRVEKLVGQKNKFKDVAFKGKVKLQERIRREEAEKKIETPARGVEKSVSNKMPVPRLGFLDVIKNFLFKLLFGALTLKLLPHLPKLKGLLITTLKIGNFGIEFAGTILNAMATFVDKAYQIIDFGKQQAKLLGGDTGVANYEKMLGMANKVINSMLIAGMLFSDLVQSDASSGAAQQATEFIKDRVIEQAGRRAAQQAAIRATTQLSARAAAGIVAGVGLLSSALGEGAFQLRKFTTKVEKDAYKGLNDAQNDPNPFTRFIKTAFYNAVAIPGMRFYNFLLNGVGTLLDVVGAPFRYAIELINYGVMFLTDDQEGMKTQRENLGKFDARIREQIREIVNTLSFGTIAKNKGSFGSLFGNQAVKSMGYASGGQVTRGGELVGGVIGRTESRKAIARTIEIPVSPLSPGSSVSGQSTYVDPTTGQTSIDSKIETFFPNPQDPRYVNPYRYLTQSFNTVSVGGFIKPLLQIPVKMVFGDGPRSGDITAIAAAVNNLLNKLLETTLSTKKETYLLDKVGAIDILGWVKKNIEEGLINATEEIKNSLYNQLGLKRSTADETKQKPKKGTKESSPMAEFAGQADAVIGDSIAHGFAGRSGNGNDTSDSQVGRSAANVLKILQSKGQSLNGKLVDLSTGIANSPGDFTSVEAQLSYLKSIGARVRVLGVANSFSEKNGNLNQKLEQIAKKYGFYFYGGYKGSADGIHGTATDYAELKAKLKRDTAATESPSGVDFDAGKGEGRRIFLHWSAGGYDTAFPAYHSIVLGDGKIVRNTPYSKDKGGHTAGGNTNSVGLAVAAAKDATQNNLKTPPTAKQLNVLVSEAAKLALSWGWSKSKVDTNVMTHGEWERYAVSKGILPPPVQRWDLDKLKQSDKFGSGGPTLRNMIKGMMFEGGYINETGNYETHPGEYVIDADSVKLFGKNFYDIINQTETIGQRKRASESLISILSQYTEDGFPETEDDYVYQVPESQVVVAPPEVLPVGSRGGGYSSGGNEDPSMDFVELR